MVFHLSLRELATLQQYGQTSFGRLVFSTVNSATISTGTFVLLPLIQKICLHIGAFSLISAYERHDCLSAPLKNCSETTVTFLYRQGLSFKFACKC